jgi:hypothetical protein
MIRGACPPDHRRQRQPGEISSSAFGENTSSIHTDGGDHLDHLMRLVGRACGELDRHGVTPNPG